MLLFSVIIPNYNHGIFLKERIDSVLNQTYTNFEVIILDDYSTDESRQIIESFRQQVKIISYSNTNSGSPFTQWKRGIDLACGEWIWIAESDDFSDLNFLQEAASAINANPSIGIFYCDSFIVKNLNPDANLKFSNLKNSFFKVEKWSHSYAESGVLEVNNYLKFVCTINNASSMVFKKKIATPLMDVVTRFKYHGDWMFYLQFCLQQQNIYYLNKALNYYRDHQSSHLNSNKNFIGSIIERFEILLFLWKQPLVTDKQNLIDFFCRYYLSFGIAEVGIKATTKIVWKLLKINRPLALEVTRRIFLLRAFTTNLQKFETLSY